MYWYQHQLLYIKWDNVVSEGFTASNGVRQGGILSPVLFIVYMDDLSTVLNESQTGCNINGVSFNHYVC